MTEPNSSDEFFAAGPTGGESDVRNGRYVLPDPATGEQRSWTRASNLGAALADRFGLERYNLRQLVRGLNLRPDLTRLLVAAVEVDNAKADEVVSQALEAAAAGASANVGTAVHEVHARVDAGLEVPAEEEGVAQAYRACLQRYGLRPLYREVRVINRALGVAGRLDALYEESDGQVVLGDVKTTEHLDLAAREFAAQLAAYATADAVEIDGKWWLIDDVPLPIRTDYALVFHVSRDTGAVSLYRLDLRLGAYAANLAAQVREWRTRRDLLLPYVPPAPILPSTVEPSSAQQSQDRRPDEAARAFPAAGNEGNGVALVDASGAEAEPAPKLLPAAAILKMTKAAAQEYGRSRGITDLAHNKPQLVKIYAAAGILADGGPTQVQTPRLNDPAELTGPVNGSDPTDPRDPAFSTDVMRRIVQASTVGNLEEIRRYVVRRGGDQAWTDQMADVARQRANAIDGQNPHGATVSRIQACQTVKDLSDLWEEVTVGGSRPEGWPDEVAEAGRVRLEQLHAARPPAPANPFGGQ